MTSGKIIIPSGRKPWPHELRVAEILAAAGHIVEFLPETNIKTADILLDGTEYEIKSPQGNSRRTIENNLRIAMKQSKNIIIDLNRIKIPEQKCVNTISRRAKKLGKKYNLMVICKNKKIVSFID